MPLCRFAIPLIVVLFTGGSAFSQTPQCVSLKGSLFAKKGNAHWDALKAGAAVPTDRLLVSLFEADLLSSNGAVEARLRGDVGEYGPLPTFESAITLHENSKVDLDITLERGILVLINKKKEGAAHVDLRIRGKTLKVTLLEPETKFGIELYSRHSPGLASIKADDPTIFLFMLNIKGATELHYQEKAISLKAPPGPALLRWDSALKELEVEHLDKLPDWVVPSAEQIKLFGQINAAAKTLSDGNPGAAFLKLLSSDDPIERKVGFTALGALGSPGALIVALQQSKHADTRQFAVSIIRSWLGQDAGQIKKVEAAAEAYKLSKANVETVLHLLLGFDTEEREQPETYQLLIAGLDHSKPLVRELSHWHLTRLVPAGRTIAYDPAGSPEDRQKGAARWRELIPAGKLPPAAK